MIRGQHGFCRLESRSLLPTLVFLPGTLCNRRVWDESVQAIGRDWPSVFVDVRFETSISAMAVVALEAVDGSIIPIGHSMGGIVALDIWRQASERVAAIALFDTDAGADTPERRSKRYAQVSAATQGSLREMVESQLLPAYFSLTRDTQDSVQTSQAALRQTVIEMAIEQGVNAFAAQATALAGRSDAWHLLDGINVPALIACGAEDRICLPETHVRMAARLPLAMATFRSIAAAGHFAPLEQPEATSRVLQSWLDGLPCWNARSVRKNVQ